ncbi:MAG: hypothetical protein NTZ02_02415, partial [Candidatus Woesearchaeota archaeon]|nr:hypothetical protein [Candidatus Woesearchaeota archaeon]
GLFAILDGNNYWKIVSLDEGNNTILIRAYDKAGLYGNETGNIFLDSITPSTSHSISGTLGENGWYTTNTTLTLTTDDGNLSSGYVTQYNKGSGLANYTSPIVISNSASVTYRAYDNAGNTESNRTTGLIKIDKQAPSVTNLTISTSLPAVNETLAIRANMERAAWLRSR